MTGRRTAGMHADDALVEYLGRIVADHNLAIVDVEGVTCGAIVIQPDHAVAAVLDALDALGHPVDVLAVWPDVPPTASPTDPVADRVTVLLDDQDRPMPTDTEHIPCGRCTRTHGDDRRARGETPAGAEIERLTELLRQADLRADLLRRQVEDLTTEAEQSRGWLTEALDAHGEDLASEVTRDRIRRAAGLQ